MSREKELKEALGLRYTPVPFRSLELARSCARRSRARWVVLGDAQEDSVVAWVVCPRDAARLERAGYEIDRLA